MSSGMTTIKVRVATREVIARAARAHGKTMDEYLMDLLTEQSWRERIAAARSAMADPDAEYLAETAAWDSLEMPELR